MGEGWKAEVDVLKKVEYKDAAVFKCALESVRRLAPLARPMSIVKLEEL